MNWPKIRNCRAAWGKVAVINGDCSHIRCRARRRGKYLLKTLGTLVRKAHTRTTKPFCAEVKRDCGDGASNSTTKTLEAVVGTIMARHAVEASIDKSVCDFDEDFRLFGS